MYYSCSMPCWPALWGGLHPRSSSSSHSSSSHSRGCWQAACSGGCIIRGPMPCSVTVRRKSVTSSKDSSSQAGLRCSLPRHMTGSTTLPAISKSPTSKASLFKQTHLSWGSGGNRSGLSSESMGPAWNYPPLLHPWGSSQKQMLPQIAVPGIFLSPPVEEEERMA